ncbi:hypothetical protein OBBRIDRAFT_81858 [Obba rivulosa]|uniref:Uncharacterized protein n=1 Tax=Obba rivulosa TaxID=1052685 RepID=A0A8E2DHU2_9APHY|nr:hypothetical protein OBBRIDRAFT_81858 [Obba rivulosa]
MECMESNVLYTWLRMTARVKSPNPLAVVMLFCGFVAGSIGQARTVLPGCSGEYRGEQLSKLFCPDVIGARSRVIVLFRNICRLALNTHDFRLDLQENIGAAYRSMGQSPRR